ncbi:hypothetical protein [Azospirillum himalayense]|uniref:Uncharacterized protein n=1 Tax=Azospirillum himalayense TaxID=654847 RepID=A0ABW0FZZ6_9PROT
MTNIDSKVLDWFIYGETGTSSRTMAMHLTGRKGKGRSFSHPSDGGDLGRCLKLLEFVPELRARLPQMAEVSPYWSALVARWDELERCHRDDPKSIYPLMRSILDPVEKKDRGVIRLGANISMSFGS